MLLKPPVINIMADSGSSPAEAAPCEAADENPVPQPVKEEQQTKDFQVQVDLQRQVSCDIVEH